MNHLLPGWNYNPTTISGGSTTNTSTASSAEAVTAATLANTDISGALGVQQQHAMIADPTSMFVGKLMVFYLIGQRLSETNQLKKGCEEIIHLITWQFQRHFKANFQFPFL